MPCVAYIGPGRNSPFVRNAAPWHILALMQSSIGWICIANQSDLTALYPSPWSLVNGHASLLLETDTIHCFTFLDSLHKSVSTAFL